MPIRGLNKVQLLGFIGKDPVVRYTSSQMVVTTLSLATSEAWQDKQTGEMKEHTEWHQVVLFGKQAEVAGEFVKTGSMVYIEGENCTRIWEDDSGVSRRITEVLVRQNGTMQILDRKPSDPLQEPPPVHDSDTPENIPF